MLRRPRGLLGLHEAAALLRRTGRAALGMDVSPSAIGLAVARWSPAARPAIEPLHTLYRPKAYGSHDPAAAAAALKAIAAEHRVGLLVVGWPLELSGNEGVQCGRVLRILHKLQANGLLTPLTLFDERYTSRQARHSFDEIGLFKRKWRRRLEDRAAAVLILENMLDLAAAPTSAAAPDSPIGSLI